ncbi:hypothetical protein K438DRAFT_1809137 [Mycena galopus ATCC 62051]|nr:hypothetical protein K438DRAFT_1809137 [Mycena galopus ATCC 62051]
MLGPRSIDSSRSSLQHQKSTKLLINRFESLSEHRPASQAAAIPPVIGTPLCPPKHSTESKKDKSPIRQSFRSFFAVLKKGSGLRGGKSKFEESKTSQKPLPNTAPPAEDPFIVSMKSCPHPVPIPQLASSLFYLARSPETSPASQGLAHCILPVWTFCSAALRGDTVHLTWPTTPSTHSVFLKHCTDVRSRTLDELDSEERALLPGDSEDLRVFEVLFNGNGVGEKFATTSVRERARWVSAIWDVILPSSSITGQVEGDKPSSATGPDSFGPSRFSTLCLDRALPPVPEPGPKPPRSPATVTPIPVSPIHRRPESCASSIYSPSKSPSIANLGRLSVVTHRRAEIERIQYPHSAPASPSRLHRNLTVKRTGSLLPQDEAAGRASPTSILESYGEIYSPQVSSPVSDEPEKQFHAGSQNESSFHSRPTVHSPSPCVDDLLLTDIHKMVSGVARRTEETENTLNIIHNRVCEPTGPEFDSTAVTKGLKDIDERLRSDLPYIMKLLAQIQACRSDIESDILSKSAEATSHSTLDKLDQILELLKEDGLQRSAQAHQQTDSVRYLNELNSWLEAFVSGGTAQIQAVAAGVEKLCQQSGCSRENGTHILAEIRQLIADGQANDQTAVLRASINNLAVLLSSESPSFAPLSIAGLIDQQRQEQEGLLRALATELSNEIRGERLRFVDAMKEATAINVQMHVEELKKELARQVRADLFAYYSKQKQPGPPPPRAAYFPQSYAPLHSSNPRYA